MSELNSAGSQLIFSTFLGGALDENTPAGGGSGALGGIAVDAKGDSFYVTGNTASTDFPFTPLAYQTTNRGVDPPKVNAFVANYSHRRFNAVSAAALTPPSVTPAGSATSTVTIAAVNGFTGKCGPVLRGFRPVECSLSADMYFRHKPGSWRIWQFESHRFHHPYDERRGLRHHRHRHWPFRDAALGHSRSDGECSELQNLSYASHPGVAPRRHCHVHRDFDLFI